MAIDRLWLKDDTRNPTLSFKDRAVAIAATRATEFGLEALACASTGNLAGATAAAAAAIGLPAYVFIPADLEPAKIDHALAYGATVVPIDGTYDDVNRLCLEVADELGWGFVNVNLRPYYAEGSKTLAFEIAEALGWRLPDVIVAPIASGAMYTKLAKGFDELAAVGLIERTPVRFVGGQAAGCAPVATAFAAGTDVIEPVRDAGHHRPLARDRQPGRWPLLGRARPGDRRVDRGDPGHDDRRGHPAGGDAGGDLPGDSRRGHAGRCRGRPEARRDPGRRRGRRAAHRERTQDPGCDPVRSPRPSGPDRRAGPAGLAPVLPPRFSAFEAWLER